jgi:hypothetical protein
MRATGLLIRGSLALLVACGVMASSSISHHAQARVFIGFGFPFFYPPPVYYPPYYAPPPAYAPQGDTFNYTPPSAQPQSLAPPRYYAPPGGYGPSGGGYAPSGGYTPSMGDEPGGTAQSCHAGAYVCPLVEDTPPGGACACPGHGGQRIRGRAD